MRIGVPSETKTLEGRVALVPAACADLVRRGHEVYVQSGAGLKSGFRDEDYAKVGVKLAPTAKKLYEAGELIVKVKEPIAGDLKLLRKDHLLFCYLHLAAEPKLTERLLDIGLAGVAFESVQEEDGALPLLAPMSIIAGRIATQIGTHLLHQPAGSARRADMIDALGSRLTDALRDTLTARLRRRALQAALPQAPSPEGMASLFCLRVAMTTHALGEAASRRKQLKDRPWWMFVAPDDPQTPAACGRQLGKVYFDAYRIFLLHRRRRRGALRHEPRLLHGHDPRFHPDRGACPH